MNKKKNILFLFPDQHRGDWLPYPKPIQDKLNTPPVPVRMDNIRNLMDEGTVFTNAVTNSPLCVPARACLASGQQYENCGVYNNSYCYPLNKKTFYNVLKSGGYRVGGVGKFDLHKPIHFWQENGWMDQLSTLGFTDAVDSAGKYDALWSSYNEPKGPFTRYLHEHGLMKTYAEDYVKRFYDIYNTDPTPLPEEAYGDNWVADQAIKMLNGFMKQEQPWFMMVNFLGPHDPWDVTSDMKYRWENVQFPAPYEFDGDLQKINAVKQNYAAMLENIDKNIGSIIETIKKNGELDNTLIVYASDHGEMLGDHSRFFKCVPNQSSIHIPIVITGPGVLKGHACRELVQLNDLASTFIDLAELDIPNTFESHSLVPYLTEKEAPPIREYQISMLHNAEKYDGPHKGYEMYEKYRKRGTDAEYIANLNEEFGIDQSQQTSAKMKVNKNWHCIVTKKYKLIEFENEPPQLYDMVNDYYETNNIASNNPEIVIKLQELYTSDHLAC